MNVESLLEHYHEHGYVILKNLLSKEELNHLRLQLQPYLDLEFQGRNDFEGLLTQRVYSLVGRGKVFEPAVEHSAILEIMGALLQPGFLLTASQAICIHAGETPQPIHSDDSFVSVPRPRSPVSISTMWALDDYTQTNGGTEIIAGSHLWSDEEVGSITGEPAGLKVLEMEAGSMAIFSGMLLHRGGANKSSAIRRGISHQYCQPWARQQENFMMSIPKERVAGMSKTVRQLLGYSIYPPFIGQLAGRHPQKSLEEGYINSLVVDDKLIANRKD